jgi:hypothetical protein
MMKGFASRKTIDEKYLPTFNSKMSMLLLEDESDEERLTTNQIMWAGDDEFCKLRQL